MIAPGIDKVGLHTRDYMVTDGLRGWSVKSGAVIGGPPSSFLRDVNGAVIDGPGFYFNGGIFNADIGPKGLLLTFNPSKVRHPFELLTDPSEVGTIADRIGLELRDKGLALNINSMQAVRVDLARQAVLKHPLTSYVPAMSHLKGKRMTGHTYPDGYSWRNTQREAVLYNKAREVKEKQGLTIPDRLGRFEVKWRKGRPLAKDLQLSSFGDFRQAPPDHLASCYRNALCRDVFQLDPKAVQLVINYDTEVSILKGYLSSGRNGAMKYLMDMNTGPHVEALGGWDVFGNLLRDAGMKDRTVRHTLQVLRSQTQRAAMVNARRDHVAVNTHTLLEELKTTFAA